MIFGVRALEAERLALLEHSARLRAALAEDLKPLHPGLAAAGLLRTGLRWASRAILVYSLLKRR